MDAIVWMMLRAVGGPLSYVAVAIASMLLGMALERRKSQYG